MASHSAFPAIIFADTVLVGDQWLSNVAITVSQAGHIESMQANQSRQAVETSAQQKGADFHANELLLPAPANLHSHAYQRAFAGLTERRSPTGSDSFWSWRSQMYQLLEKLRPEDIAAVSAQVYMEMLEAGFASVGEFHYLHHQPDGEPYANIAELSERVAEAASLSGIGLSLLPVLYSFAGCEQQPLSAGQRRFGNDTAQFERLLSGAQAAVNRLPEDSLLGIAPHSLRAVSPDGIRFADSWSRAHDRPIHIHIAEQTAEVEEVLAATGQRSVAWLLDHAEVDARWCLIHATHMDEAETLGLAKSNAVAGLCPITEANLGDGIFPGKAYLAAGGRFGVGSDSNVLISLTGELSLLEYSQRLQHRARGVMAEAGGSTGKLLWRRACQGGAQALGRGRGEIAVGEWADLVSYRKAPLAMLTSAEDAWLDTLLFATSRPTVDNVWSAGRLCVLGGRHIARDTIVDAYQTSAQYLREG